MIKLVLLACCLVSVPRPTWAAPITYAFTGTMDTDPYQDPGDDALRTIVGGTPFSGTFWYEFAPVPTGGTLGWGRADLDMFHFGYTFSFEALSIHDGDRFETINAFDGGTLGDFFAIHDEVPLGARLVDEILVSFRFQPGTFTDGLSAHLNPSDFLDGQVRLTVNNNPTVLYDQSGTIPTLTQVPEPGTLLLFGVGLTVAIVRRRR
jgi:hypothetical protein